MKYLPFLLFFTACSSEQDDSELYISQSEIEPTSYSIYLESRKSEPPYEFIWSDSISRQNDSTLISNQELLERYGSTYADFGLFDWNDDGYSDLFFEYYAEAGTGVKFRVDVYEFNPETGKYKEEDYGYMNPAFYYDRGIITSHYWGNGGGYGAKFQVKNGIIDTLEWIDIDIFAPDRTIDSVVYICKQFENMSITRVTDTMVYLPSEYTYQKMVKN